MAGAAGGALIFFMLVGLLGIVCAGVFAYASRCFFIVVQDTAAGVDEVRWPDEPYYDWIWQAFYLLLLLFVVWAPVGLVLRINRDFAIGESRLLTYFILLGVFQWGLFPIVLFSSMSGPYKWVIFRPVILWFLLRRLPDSVIFYGASAVLYAVSLGLGYLAFSSGSQVWTFVAPPFIAAAYMIYARLLGRMAWLFAQTRLPRRQNTDVGREAVKPRKRPKKSGSKVEDPWAVPDEPPPPKRKRASSSGGVYHLTEPEASPRPPDESAPARKRRKIKGYAVKEDQGPPPPPIVPLDGFPAVGMEPIPVKQEPESSPEAERLRGASLPTPTSLDLQLAKRPEEAPPPPIPLVSGVYTFPCYPETFKHGLLLAVGGIGIGLLISAIQAMAPL